MGSRSSTVTPVSQGGAADDFDTAHDSTDLIPGNTRAVTAVADAVRHSASDLTDVTATSIRITKGLEWSGPAAEAFGAHQHAVVTTLDQWTDAYHLVHQTLADHQTALAAAQDKAAHALTIWRTAHQQASEAARWDNEGNAVAANADSLRAQVRNQFATATQYARTLLQQARAELAQAGDRAADAVGAAVRTLRGADLPDLRGAAVHSHRPSPTPPTWSGQTVTVQPPEHGIHDSLSRIAQRTLGDARRWPEIYQLNAGHQVGPHAVLRNPNLIQPGWTLRVPATPTPQPTITPPTVLPPLATGAPHIAPPSSGHTVSPLPPAPHPSPAAPLHTAPRGGISLGEGVLIAGGVAAALGGLAAAVGLRGHRRREAHSAPEPVVHQINASLAATPRPDDGVLGRDAGIPLGVRDDHTVLLDTAATFGLGLTGPGSVATLRTILVSILAADPKNSAIITAREVRRLLGSTWWPTDHPNDHPPDRIAIVSDHNEVLNLAEAEILTRTRLLEASGGRFTPPLLLLITAAPDDPNRLQAVADLGVGLGIVVIVLGSWSASVTCHVTADGYIDSATGPDWTNALLGLQAFTASVDVTRELLALLQPQQTEQPATISPGINKPRPDTQAASGKSAVSLSQTAKDIRSTLSPAAAAPAPRHRPSPTNKQSDSTHTNVRARSLPNTAVDGPVVASGSPTLAHPATPPNGGPLSAGQDLAVLPTEHGACTTPAAQAGKTSRAKDTNDSDPATASLDLVVLGRLRLVQHVSGEERDITEVLAPKQREILAYLALHRDGIRRDALTAHLWPEATTVQSRNNFHATLSQMRRALRDTVDRGLGSIIVARNGHYAINKDIASVDLWEVQAALHEYQHPSDENHRIVALRRVAEFGHGDLAGGVDAEWLEGPREALRRDVLDALSALVRVLERGEPERMLAVLEQARQLDRYNEAIYSDIVRVQARLGRRDAIPRTLSLLRATLVELDRQPSRDTVALCESLQYPTAQHAVAMTPHARRPSQGRVTMTRIESRRAD